MSPHLHWPRLRRRRDDARPDMRRAPVLVPGIILLSVLAGAAQVAGLALPRDDAGLSQAAPSPALPRDDGAAVVVPVDMVDVPPATVQAVEL